MTWKPSDGVKRGDAVVRQYAEDMSRELAFMICPMMQSRLLDLVAQALDQALADGAEKAAMDKVVGNFPGALVLGAAMPLPYKDVASGITVYPDPGTWLQNGHADPVVEAREEGPRPGTTDSDVAARHDMRQLPALSADQMRGKLLAQLEDLPSKKRRGRPPGARGKKAKVKAAKAKKETVPVAETVAPTVTEPSEASQ